MECTGYDEKNDEYILKDEHSTFYYKKGDCTLIEIQKYEQLKLF